MLRPLASRPSRRAVLRARCCWRVIVIGHLTGAPHGSSRSTEGVPEIRESLRAGRTVGLSLRLGLLAITNEVLPTLLVSACTLARRKFLTRGIVLSLHAGRSNSSILSDASGEQRQQQQ
jgi:hypothetical protein